MKGQNIFPEKEQQENDVEKHDGGINSAQFALLAAASSMNYLGTEQPQAQLLQWELAREMIVNEFALTQQNDDGHDERLD